MPPRSAHTPLFVAPHLAAAMAALLLTTAAHGASLVHDYTLQNTYADSLGGPSLSPLAGSLSAAGYTFPANQGLSLSSAFANPGSYSIVLDFRFTTTSGYRRIIEFKNRGADTGLYVLNSHLNFYNVTTSNTDSFQPNTLYRVVLTRDATNNSVAAYLNGTQSLSFTDSGSLAVFTAASNVAWFFTDDAVVQNEASPGFVNHVSIYDGALTAAQVSSLGSPAGFKPGDANLNGVIDPDDFALTDRGFAGHLAGWSNGDFNDDSTVNSADYFILDTALKNQGGAYSPDLLAQRQAQFGPEYVGALVGDVPEPATLAVAALALLPLARRRHRS